MNLLATFKDIVSVDVPQIIDVLKDSVSNVRCRGAAQWANRLSNVSV